MVSYAANAEDVVLHRALCQDDGGVGLYVDVGAASPYVGSVTRHFYDAGWNGIDVEPLSEEAAELRRARPRDVVVEAALGSTSGEISVHVVLDERGLSSSDADVAAGYARAGRPMEERVVRLRTLADVLEENDVGDISFLKIDVEGAESEVLAGNDWTRWRPRVVVVEATRPWSHEETHAGWEPLLLGSGYLFASFDGVNRYYSHAEEPQLVTMLAPATVLDNFVPENLDRVEKYVHHLETELATKLAWTADLESRINRAEAALSRAEAELGARRAHLEQLETYVGHLESELHTKDNYILELEARCR